MKKMLLAFLVSFLLTGSMYAQTPEKKKETTSTTKTKAAPVKKDGTPDMRYKENKAAKEAKPAGPLKKDGTPDKRYKANKEKS